MRYLIIGSGGTGGTLGYYLTLHHKDVTLIARNKHLEVMQEKGLTLEKLWDHSTHTISVKACTMDDYQEKADVIFVCVKGYSIDDCIPFIKKASHQKTIIIPILNIYDTGGMMAKQLPGLTVLDGCIYVSANIKEPGVLLQHGPILRVVYGMRNHEITEPLKLIEKDLKDSEIEPVLSTHIQRDTLEKFSYVSPIGALGLYLNAKAGDFQKEGEPREMFKTMIQEIMTLAKTMGYPFDDDYVKINLEILKGLPASATTSMQRDVYAGHLSEIEGLVYHVVELSKEYGITLPLYQKVAEKLKKEGL